MALGSQSVLGISSNLSWDTINQLKENDVKNQIEPITKKIEKNLEKQTELTDLLTKMTTLQTSFKNLSDFSTFQKRSASVEGSGVKATAGEGLAIQDIELEVKQLAKNDINQVGLKYASRDSTFTTKNTSLSFYHNGSNYNIDIKAGATLSEVAQSITDATDGAVMGIIMKTGGDNPYQLMIQSKDSGKQNKIYFGNTIESAAMPGGKIEEGKLKLNIAGSDVEIDFTGGFGDYTNTSEQNAKLVLDKIKDKINTDSSLADLKAKLDSGEVTIDLNGSGKGLMINDSSGREITVTPENIKTAAYSGQPPIDTDLGFVKTTTAGANNLVTGKSSVKDNLSGILNINGQKIDLANLSGSGTNAEKIADAINNNTALQNSIKAEVKDGKLVLNSLDNSNITISADGDEAVKKETLDSVGLTAGTYATKQSFLKEMNITNISKAQNAEFTYNGIQIERDKNSIDDVVSGLSLELTEVTEANKSVIVRIARDNEGISEEMENFVKNYNEVYNKIQELVKYDEDTKLAGVFNGNSEVRSITRQLNSIINSNDVNGKNLVGYGVYINEDGTLKFEKDKFETAYKDDPDSAIAFFRSTTSTIGGTTKEVDGVFTKLRNVMDGLITGDKSTLKILESTLTSEQKTLNEDKTSTQEYIDSRYETMASKWSAYDQLISKTQQQSSVIMQMINQSMNN